MQFNFLKVMAFSFLISLIISPIFIALSRKLQYGQYIREDGPKRHYCKAGTPTMGGIIFLVSLVLSSFFLAPKNIYLFLLLMITLGNGLIGFLDDYFKVVNRRSLGLRARHKLAGQLLLVAIFSVVLFWIGHSTAVKIPFTDLVIDLGYFYPLLIFLMLIGTSNAVNITDGIDGLAGGTVTIALLAYLIIAALQGIEAVAYFNSAFIGGIFGFLVYNLHPAKVFMGDVGSLALGSALAAVAILTKAELLLLIIGGVFVIETISVIMQVIFYRITGRRVFLMSPLHHHFELKGYSEWRVVTGFWGLGFLFAVIGLFNYRIFL
ncbi:MAG: phospho-N-acetylmuramoyl-pentapeptide-transferase [Dethiobacteria bacterium]|jgi:phospho-N-acetylmuramoyl-pentapeptide-transferase